MLMTTVEAYIYTTTTMPSFANVAYPVRSSLEFIPQAYESTLIFLFAIMFLDNIASSGGALYADYRNKASIVNSIVSGNLALQSVAIFLFMACCVVL